MNPSSSKTALIRQHQKFRELFEQATRQHGQPLGSKIASPKSVLSFAEDLMLCPTEDAALIRIARDLEAARGCHIIGGDVAAAACIGRAEILIQTSNLETPFCLFATVVGLLCETAIEKYGDHWMVPEFRQQDCDY